MSVRKFKFNKTLLIQLMIIWLIFQSVISSSLLKYSNYQNVLFWVRHITTAIRLFMVVSGIFVLAQKKLQKKYLIVLCIYALILVISKFYNDSYQFLDALYIAFIFRNKLNKKSIVNTFFYTIIISCSVVILAYFVGLFPNYVVRRFDGRERMYLGFAHPNSLGYYVMIICFLYILRIKDKIKYIHIAVLVVAFYFVYVYPNSISSAISILLLVLYLLINKLYLFLFKKNVIKNNFIRFISIAVVPAIIVVVYLFVANSSGSFYADDTLRTFYARFRLGSQAIQQYGIHLFGTRDIEFVGTATRYFGGDGRKYFTVDCFYVQILVKYGVIPSLFFFAYYIFSIRTCIKAKDSDVMAMFIIMTIYSINESMMLAMPSSFLFIIASTYGKLEDKAYLNIFSKDMSQSIVCQAEGYNS